MLDWDVEGCIHWRVVLIWVEVSLHVLFQWAVIRVFHLRLRYTQLPKVILTPHIQISLELPLLFYLQGLLNDFLAEAKRLLLHIIVSED